MTKAEEKMATSHAGTPTSMNVRSVVRATLILKSFSARPTQTLAEIAAATELDKGTTRRLLVTLMNQGFVVQDQSTQRYGLGRVVRTLASRALEHFDLRSVAVPILEALARRLHTTMLLSVMRDRSPLCLERIHDIQGTDVRWWAVGGSLPFNSGAAPKLLLAYQPQSEIDAILAEQPLQPINPHAIVDEAVYRERLREIRRRGWEFAEDDVAAGLSGLAVPVLDEDGAIVCALSLAGLTPQMSVQGKPVHLELMLEAAETVRRLLGITAGPPASPASAGPDRPGPL